MSKKASEDGLAPLEREFLYYPLEDLLPTGHVLALNKHLGILSQLAPAEDGESWPRLIVEQQFSASELSLLLPLLEAHPIYCPHETLYASFNGGDTTEAGVERARLRLQEARFAGVWDYEIRSLRNVLSRMRYKLGAFGLDARSLLETGYLLCANRRLGRRQEKE
jgi:hypothetical protein